MASRADANASIEASQQALAATLAQSSRRCSLLDHRAVLLKRAAELRAVAERRAAALKARRKQLEESTQKLFERRRRHEARAVQWATARRQLEVKRSRISREEFLQDPAQHYAVLGAFHVYQELSVVSTALQTERRRKCAEAASVFPLKRIGSGDAPSLHTMTLGQVQCFTGMGVLRDEDVRDLRAALSFLVHLLVVVARYLDVTLPFPCILGRGVAASYANENCGSVASTRVCAGGHGRGREMFRVEGDDTIEGSASYDDHGLVVGGVPTAASPRVTRARSRSPDLNAPWWISPCVLHPFTGRWLYFSIYDGICTREFETAIRLIDEDLRQMCACQGEASPAHFSTLQLLAHLLSAPHLGCSSPPRPASVNSSSATETPGTSSAASGTRDSAVSSATVFSPALGFVARPRTESESLVSSRGPTRHGSPRLTVSSAPVSARDITVYEDGEWTVVEHEDSGVI